MFATILKSPLIGATIASLLLSAVNAHMVITSPVPYGQDSLTNSPLLDDGSDFPCKQRSGVYDVTKMNTIPVGTPQHLAFMGGATHGGGSCQLSITTDTKPTKDSQWKVIHSIIGGCPSNATGNLGESASETDAAVFEYTLDKQIPDGEYALAWTWFNKIGNREMYMNCAPITVTGGASSGSGGKSYLESLPDMFVINIPSEQCASVEGEDFVFPSPGESAVTPFSTALGSKTVGSGCASVTKKGAGAGSMGAVATSAAGGGGGGRGGSSVIATTAAAIPSQVATVSSNAGGDAPITITTLATVTGSSGGDAPAATTAAAISSAPSTPDSGTSSGSSSSDSGSSDGTSCSTEGAVICSGTSKFGLCNNGNVVFQDVADGTTCENGAIARKKVKRESRHVHRHVAGRLSF